MRNPDRPFLATLPSPHHHQRLARARGPKPYNGQAHTIPYNQTIQWAGHTMPYNGQANLLPGKPTHLTMAPTIHQQLDTLEGNGCNARCSTPPCQVLNQTSHTATRFLLFGNSRCVCALSMLPVGWANTCFLWLGGMNQAQTMLSSARACACQTAICTTGIRPAACKCARIYSYKMVILQCYSLSAIPFFNVSQWPHPRGAHQVHMKWRDNRRCSHCDR